MPLFQSESKCQTILLKMTLICMKMKLHAELIFIIMKGFALTLVLKKRHKRTRKWPIKVQCCDARLIIIYPVQLRYTWITETAFNFAVFFQYLLHSRKIPVCCQWVISFIEPSFVPMKKRLGRGWLWQKIFSGHVQAWSFLGRSFK